jgi:hypothetical protein
MNVGWIRRRHLNVVRPYGIRVTGVLARRGHDRGVVTWHGEDAASGQRAGVRLHLEVPLVNEPVADIGDEDDEGEKHRQPDCEHDQYDPLVVARSHQEHPAA